MSLNAEFLSKQGAPVEKVTTFILSRRAGIDSLLLLYHPTAGIQLPAGTVEAGESPVAAALREAQEETGLSMLGWGGLCGEEQEELADCVGLVALNTPVYIQPTDAMYNYATATLRRGIMVDVLRAQGDFLQVRYIEYDRYPDAQYVSFELCGWVPAKTIAGTRIRYFAWLVAPDDMPDMWVNRDESHLFTLRWHPLNDLPNLVDRQAPWLRFLPR